MGLVKFFKYNKKTTSENREKENLEEKLSVKKRKK